MNSVALFVYGLLVTILVGVGIGLLVWGAILDGRYDREMRKRLAETGQPDGLVVQPPARAATESREAVAGRP